MSEIRQLYDLLDSLLDEVRNYYAIHKTISEELLCSLSTLLGARLEAALDLCDHECVSLVTSPSGYTIYNCRGSSGTPYYLPTSLTFCPCWSFRHITQQSREIPLCKHLLAILLTRAMGQTRQREVTDAIMEDILLEFDDE